MPTPQRPRMSVVGPIVAPARQKERAQWRNWALSVRWYALLAQLQPEVDPQLRHL